MREGFWKNPIIPVVSQTGNTMQKLFLLFAVSFFFGLMATAQSPEEIRKTIDDLNRAIDKAVVKKDVAFLQKHYADDFVFTHGTGNIDSKESWIKNIQNMPADTRFASREHDSTFVEPHGNIAIITGKLSVQRQSKEKITDYYVKYVRVFVLRKKVWQMISHRTYFERHLN
jgi:ketosteroid isomerase-like protein